MQPIFENRAAFLCSWWHFLLLYVASLSAIIWYFNRHFREEFFSLLSPRRLRAKYTHCTNCVYAMGISPLRGANSRKRELQMLTHLNWPPQGGYVCKHTAYAAHSQSVPPYLRLLRSDTAICRREDKAQYRDIHLSAWASCLMSGVESLIYPAMRNRKICMRYMKL